MSTLPFARGILGKDRILHGGDYNPDQWLDYPEVLDEDFRLMKLAGCNTFSLGIFAWSSYEAEEGKYTFEWLDAIMDRMARDGHKVILATPSGAKPNWMAHKYPEIRRVNEQGLREFQGHRHNHCWSSPVYRRKVTAINTQLAERYRDHPALGMWHISNEYSGHCYCDLCLASWHRWLEDRYGSLDALNHAWWTGFWSHRFTAWSEVDPRDTSMDGLSLDWMRFLTWQVKSFFLHEIEPLRATTPDVPCTANFMGTFGGLNYAELATAMDLVADDQYPAYDTSNPDLARSAAAVSFKHDLYRCFKPDRPWMLMESCPDATNWREPRRLKRPGLHEAEMLQSIGHGAEGTLYFQWRKGRGGCEKFHGAVVDHIGNENNFVFRRVADYAKILDKLKPVLGTDVHAEVAFLYDWEVRWAWEVCAGTPSGNGAYDKTMHDHYLPFWEAGIPVDVFDSSRDFSSYKVVVAPLLFMLKPGVAERLRSFVEKGGTLVATYFTGIVDPTNLCFMGGWPGEGLKEVFGVWCEDHDVQNSGTVRSLNAVSGNSLGIEGDLTALEISALAHEEGAEAVARYADDFYAGTPALTVHTFGQGKAIYLGAKFDVDSLRKIHGSVASQAGVRRALEASYPRGVAVQGREKDGRAYLFLQNFSVEPAKVDLPAGSFRRLVSGEMASGSLELPACGSEVLAVE
ncbi:MAG TPA: beta-galactosidase [Fimbriimonas sp.]